MIFSIPDPSIGLYPSDYCDIVKEITKSACFETSLLEMWAADQYGIVTRDLIKNLTLDDVLSKVNNPYGFRWVHLVGLSDANGVSSLPLLMYVTPFQWGF